MSKRSLPTWMRAIGATGLLTAAAVSHAAITPYSDNFETYGVAGVPNVGVDFFTPWQGFSDNGGFPGGYTFDPSIDGPQITALGYNGSDNQYMNMYANYDNVNVHDRGACSPCSPSTFENISVFIEQSFTGADTASGDTWMFKFNYRQADVPPGGTTTTAAFIRVFDPIFNILYEATLDTNISDEWRTGVLTVPLDPAWVDGVVQIGFTNSVELYNDSGVFYDDVVWQQALPGNVDIQGGFGASGEQVHPHHDGRFLTLGSLPDDIVPVIVLGSDTTVGDPIDLDTADIVTASVRFGPGDGEPESVTTVDDDGDGIDDARFEFLMSNANFVCDEADATLSGDLTTGDSFVGSDGFIANCNAQCHL